MIDNIDYKQIYDSLERCKDIIFSENLDEFFENLNKSITEEYTKEQCYIDILKTAMFKPGLLNNFTKHIMQSRNQKDIELLIKNLYVISSRDISILLDELEEYNIKEILKECLKKGVINYYKTEILELLLEDEEGRKIIEENFSNLFSKGYEFGLLKRIMEAAKIPKERVLEKKEEILKNAYGEDLLLFIKWFNEEKIFNDSDISIENFIKQTYNKIEDNLSLKMLEIFYKGFISKQNVTIKSIEMIGKGEYSSSYKIGDFVLKLGKERKTNIIPYHRRILQPLLRQETNPGNESNLYIEIQNIVENNWYENMTEEQIQEELYKIYKEMRSQGVLWTDIKKENIGRLLKPNRTNYKTKSLQGDLQDKDSLKVVEEELEVSDNSTGIINRISELSLNVGELVILDTDMIFRLEDIDIEEDMKSHHQPKYIRYEQRYLYELAQAKGER